MPSKKLFTKGTIVENKAGGKGEIFFTLVADDKVTIMEGDKTIQELPGGTYYIVSWQKGNKTFELAKDLKLSKS